MVERVSDRKAELLDAAVRVFAEKGFHASRVGDIATEAGVAHGLLYHYFRSKDDVLDTVFRDTWSALVAETRRIESSDYPLREQLRLFAASTSGRGCRRPTSCACSCARSLAVRRSAAGSRRSASSSTRSPASSRAAQARGEARADIDPTIAAWALYGAHEEILTGWVLGRLPGDANDVDRAVTTVVDVVHAGLAA